MTQWSCYCIEESVCYWLEKGNSMDTWRRRTHNTWRCRSTLIKSERCYWMTASLYRKYNAFSDRESEQQHRTMTFTELPNRPLLLTMDQLIQRNLITKHGDLRYAILRNALRKIEYYKLEIAYYKLSHGNVNSYHWEKSKHTMVPMHYLFIFNLIIWNVCTSLTQIEDIDIQFVTTTENKRIAISKYKKCTLREPRIQKYPRILR